MAVTAPFGGGVGVGREMQRLGRFHQHAAHIDDGAARAVLLRSLLQQAAGDGAAHAEHESQIVREGGIPAFVIDLMHRPVAEAPAAQSGHVEQRVHAAEPGEALGEQRWLPNRDA